MHSSRDYIHDPRTAHNPAEHELLHITGRVYQHDVDLVYYIRLPPREVPRHHRTGKPAMCVSYVGLPTEFTHQDLVDLLPLVS